VMADTRNAYLEFRKEVDELQEALVLAELKKILQELEKQGYPYELLRGKVVQREVDIYSPRNGAWWGTVTVYEVAPTSIHAAGAK